MPSMGTFARSLMDGIVLKCQYVESRQPYASSTIFQPIASARA